jgi:hypothetical protein
LVGSFAFLALGPSSILFLAFSLFTFLARAFTLFCKAHPNVHKALPTNSFPLWRPSPGSKIYEAGFLNTDKALGYRLYWNWACAQLSIHVGPSPPALIAGKPAGFFTYQQIKFVVWLQ